MPTFSIFTFGCRLNQADSALLVNQLDQHGFIQLPWGQVADLILINSCTVTAVAAQKNRQAVNKARRFAPDSFIVLLGCDASAEKESWGKNEKIDLFIPNPKPDDIFPLLPEKLFHNTGLPAQYFAAPALQENFTISGTGFYPDKTRANLKIQEGCDYFCSYCIVPYTRGPSRSRNLQDVLREAEELLSRGHKELVLSGVNISCYQNSGKNLPALIAEILKLGNDFRIRLGSTEPGECLDELIDLMAENKQICRFLHLPLQYGEDSILQKMGRHYDSATYKKVVDKAAEIMPGICLGTDIIAGFPGETEETFKKCKEFVKSIPFALMHVFPYSERKGTAAAEFKNRPTKQKATERAAILRKIATDKYKKFAESQIGETLEVLLEKDSPNAEGWSDNYLKVKVKSDKMLLANNFIKAKVNSCEKNRTVIATAIS